MKTSKKVILSCLVVLLIAVGIYYTYYFFHYVNYKEYKKYLTEYDALEGKEFTALSDSDPQVEGMVLAAENDFLKLYTNLKTAEVAIYDKRNGSVTYSNPQDIDNDTTTSEAIKNNIKSQISIEYYNDRRSLGIMNSFDMAIEFGQIAIESIDQGIRYTYTLGDTSTATGIVPIYISEERLGKYMDLMEEKEARSVRATYVDSDIEGMKVLPENAQKGKATMRKFNDYFAKAGYTGEDYYADMEAAGATDGAKVTLTVPLEYRLDGDSLVVSVPANQIVETGGAKISRINVLSFMGAAGPEEKGYMLVPNGSGSLIYFNNGKTNAQPYSQYVYGIDPTTEATYSVESQENARLPLFGISKEGSDLLVTIEEGDSLAFINATVAGKTNNYNNVYAGFVLRGADVLATSGMTGREAELPTVEKDLYNVNLTMKYSFLVEEDEGYSGMANYFRERLINEGILTLSDTKDSIPFFLNLLGGVERISYFLGKQYFETYPMTTFDEAETMINDMKNSGVTNISLNYMGWFNGGYYHDLPEDIKVIRKLGGKKGLSDLTELVEANGGKLYGSVALQKVSFADNHYDYMKESARYYTGGVLIFGQKSPVDLSQRSSLGYMETLYNLLSPKFLPRYVEGFTKEIQKVNVSGISLRDLGDTLHSDKKRTEFINRENSKKVVMAMFDQIAETEKELQIEGGNYYSLAYAKEIINMPLSHNTYYIVDEEIPFYQMIIHGAIDYTGYSINLTDASDVKDIVLRLIEYGAAPQFTFSYEDSSELKYTGLNSLYSITYSKWAEKAKAIYKEVNGVLAPVVNSTILNHQVIEPGVKKVTYANGVILYINSSSKKVTVDGIAISSKGYEVKGVE